MRWNASGKSLDITAFALTPSQPNNRLLKTFHAVLGGLKRFEKPIVWLGGGESKGGDIEDFARRIAPNLKYASLIGKTAIQLGKALNRDRIETTIHDSLEEAVTEAFAIAALEDNIVFSPGFASFDMFENYVQRGEAFRKAIDCL